MRKKALSMMLAICMLVSLLPAVPLAGAADSISYTYNFVGLRNNAVSVKDVKYSETGDMWEFGDSNIGTVRAHKFGIEANASTTGHYVALKIKIPTSGTFGVMYTHGRSTSLAGYGNVYFLPGDTTDIATAIASAKPIGENIGYYDASNGTQNTVPLSDIVVPDGKAGEYLLVFSATEKGANNYRMYISDIVLTEKEESEIPEVVYSGYRAVYDFTKVATDGRDTTYQTTDNFWRFDAVSEDFETTADSFKKRSYGIQVQGLGSGKWAALALNVPVAGTYKLTLDHTLASQGGVAQWYIMPADADVDAGLSNTDYKLENTIDFYNSETTTGSTELGDYTFDNAGEHLLVLTYVGNSPNYTQTATRSAQYPTKLTLDGGERTAPMSLSATLEGEVNVDSYAAVAVSALMSDGATSEIAANKLSFKSLDESIATVDANGYVTGISEGDAIIEFVTKDGAAKGRVSVTVGPRGEAQTLFVYDFNEGLATGTKVNTISEYGTTRGLWKYENANGASVASSTVHKWGMELRTASEDEWVAFRIKVTNGGRYFATLTHGQSATLGGYGNVYILPEDTADISEALKTATPIGTDIAYYGAVNTEAVITELSGIDLSVGEHILVFAASKKGGSNFRQYPGFLELDASNIFRMLEFNVDKTAYNIYPDGTTDKGKATYSAHLLDGSEIPEDELTVVYGSEDDTIAECLDGEIVPTGHGKTNVFVTVTHNGRTMTKKKEITVTDISGVDTVSVSADEINFKGEKAKLSTELIFKSGKSIKLSDSEVTYEIVGEIGEIVDGQYVTYSEAGAVSVIAKASFGGEIYTSEPYQIIFREPTTKRGSTYFTYERREAAQENVKKYDWAKALLDTAKKGAEPRLEKVEYLYDHMTGEGIPRSNRVGAEGDPDYIYCRYCGNDNASEYGSRGGGVYDTDIYGQKWKVQCPDCKRLFPSNDFGLLYERGLDEHGYYNNERARKANAGAVANGEKDALHNDLYPELYDVTKESYNKDPMTGEAVDGECWGVDDGLGYLPGRTYANGVEERHGYIAFYTHNLWIEVRNAIRYFGDAYVYSGDAKYGRAGAVLVDRIADLYPSFSYKQWDNMYLVAHGGSGYGKIYGRINDNDYATAFIKYADAFYPLYDDPQIVSFLSGKAKKYNLDNSKESGAKIWANIEDGLLRDVFKSAKEGNIYGNYGQLQGTLAAVALVLDREPESSQIVDWIYQPGAWSQDTKTNTAKCTGGNLSIQLVDVVDRDGAGNEASPRYNTSWIERLYDCADMLRMYSTEPKYDLYQNPKYAKMFTAHIPMALVESFTAQIGDTGATANIEFQDGIDCLIRGFMGLKDTELGNTLAEYLYMRNGYTEKGLHYDIFTDDPTSMEKDILALMDDDLKVKSEMLTGYGFAVLREGDKYGAESSTTYVNDMRDFWIYFGSNDGHGHLDTLNLGIEAFGMNMAPDNGYPEVASTDPHRYQWMEATVAHNTVTVNEKSQLAKQTVAEPLHFDDSGDVKVMDISAPDRYAETNIYRRTVVMINAGDNVSYGIDFFRVKGGNDHIYSFHALSDEICETEGLGEIKYQTDDGTENGNFIGSYAGANIKYGPDPANTYVVANLQCPQGFTWMKNVRKAAEVGKFSVDFKVEDFRKVLKDGDGLHMRMTMLNDFPLTEVALTSGNVANKSENKELPKTLEYVLARRKGENLDSLYTTVYEPYRNERYISDMAAVDIKTSEGTPKADDAAKAVKVIRADGRIDYIMYATNNNVLYTVTDGERKINFRGFVGVYSVNALGEKIYSYVNDGDVIGEESGLLDAYTGKVSDFTRELSLTNTISVKTSDDIDVGALKDKYVFITNDAVQNAVYKIEAAEKTDDGIKLDIGTVSVIRSYKDSNDTSKGFVYNVAKGQSVSIPVSNVDDGSPVFDEISGALTASAGSSVSVKLTASCDDGSKILYVGTTLPRGMTLDAESGTLTWKPSASQIGENHIAVTAIDELGRESTAHFTVTVYGSTTGGSSGGGTGSSGASGEGSATQKPEDAATEPTTPDTPSTDSEDTGTGSSDSDVRFIDLGNHAWASDAINALADEGIIKGTSENTFSPAANITRADFALLLVRAFKLESENTENFNDVLDTDYFARELAIARNTGIVNGIGDNNYAPGNTITRQDMMTIVYRALNSLSLDGKVVPEASDEVVYPDFDTVSGYAKDAVSALISAGLVNGKNGLIAPTDYTTRAEVAVLLKRILDYIAE